jgi:hypothetical protein
MPKHGATSLTTGGVRTGTWQSVSLHRRNAAEDETGMTKIFTMSSVAMMHEAGSKTGIRSMSALNRRSVKMRTMTSMVPIMTNLTDSVLPKGACNAGGVKAFPHDLKMVHWLLCFKPSGIEKYDGSTNLAEWLKVYQLAIEATSGDSYIMANYLPVYLSPSARTWLLGLPAGLVHSYNHLCRLFTRNFSAMCAHLRVNWHPAGVIQKKGESLREFI